MENPNILIPNLAIELIDIERPKPWPGHARDHGKPKIRKLANGIRHFGFVVPVTLDQNDMIVFGHAQIAAAKLLGMKVVPATRIEHLSAVDLQALRLFDNRITEEAEWDDEKLLAEIKAILAIDADYDLSLTGFELPEVDGLMFGSQEPDPKANAVRFADRSKPAVTRVGDLFQLGPHRLLCGDALKPEILKTLLGGQQAELVISDPPFGVPIAGHVSGLGTIKHPEFVMMSGDMPDEELFGCFKTAIQNLATSSKNGALIYIFIDWRHIRLILNAGEALSLALINIAVWNKNNGGMGSFYRSKHELVVIFKSGNGRHINNIELGRFGNYRTNVWDYPGISSFGAGRQAQLAMHPTTKPVELISDAILDASSRGGIVLDSFAGSGTIFMAAERTGRRAFGLELDPYYCDTIILRWQNYTGQDAIHQETGLSFSALAAERAETVVHAEADTEAHPMNPNDPANAVRSNIGAQP